MFCVLGVYYVRLHSTVKILGDPMTGTRLAAVAHLYTIPQPAAFGWPGYPPKQFHHPSETVTPDPESHGAGVTMDWAL